MDDSSIKNVPSIYPQLLSKCEEIGFTMPSDLYIGPLLKTLVASKPGAHVLELGTGIGLSLVWLVEGMDQNASLITVDNDHKLSTIAEEFFGHHENVRIVCEDGAVWLAQYDGPSFDVIFADAWPGKYSDLEKTLDLVKTGGFYIIDDMSEHPNWPEGHSQKVAQLIEYLEGRTDFNIVKMNWSTGVIIAVKTS